MEGEESEELQKEGENMVQWQVFLKRGLKLFLFNFLSFYSFYYFYIFYKFYHFQKLF